MGSEEKNEMLEKLRITLKDVLMLLSFLGAGVVIWIRIETTNAVQDIRIAQTEDEISEHSTELTNIDDKLDYIKEGLDRLIGRQEVEKESE